MRLSKSLAAIIFLAFPALFGGPVASAQTTIAPEPEILAQGPIHEAFAQPAEGGNPQPGPVVVKQPPAPIEELPPDQKPQGRDVRWIPGYWQWDDDRSDFIWVSGVWRDLPPGEQWLPGNWRQVDGGWQWVSGFWAPAQQNDLSYQPPPPPTLDAGPSAPSPGDDYFYNPGCWVYRQQRYLWRPGSWQGFQPGFVWTPSSYAWTPAGCVFNDGYWDYPLASRGCLFAPAYFPQQLGGWSGPWTPQYAIGPQFLPGALFLGPGHRGYYFGNYYGPGYQQAGYQPWFNNRLARWGGDPLFSYYRHNLGGAGWERNLRGLYAGRGSGRLAPLPRTLAQQTTLLNRLNRQSNSVQNVRNMTVLSPLSGLSRQGVGLTRINRAERLRQGQAANQLRGVGQQRLAREQNLVRRGAGPGRPATSPQTVRLNGSGAGRVGRAPVRSFGTPSPQPGRAAVRGSQAPPFAQRGYSPAVRTPARPATVAPRYGAARVQAPRPQAARPTAPRYVRPQMQAPRRVQAARPTYAPRQAPAARWQPRPAAPARHVQQHYAAPRPVQQHRAAPAPRPVQHATAHGGHRR